MCRDLAVYAIVAAENPGDPLEKVRLEDFVMCEPCAGRWVVARHSDPDCIPWSWRVDWLAR